MPLQTPRLSALRGIPGPDDAERARIDRDYAEASERAAEALAAVAVCEAERAARIAARLSGRSG